MVGMVFEKTMHFWKQYLGVWICSVSIRLRAPCACFKGIYNPFLCACSSPSPYMISTKCFESLRNWTSNRLHVRINDRWAWWRIDRWAWWRIDLHRWAWWSIDLDRSAWWRIDLDPGPLSIMTYWPGQLSMTTFWAWPLSMTTYRLSKCHLK